MQHIDGRAMNCLEKTLVHKPHFGIFSRILSMRRINDQT